MSEQVATWVAGNPTFASAVAFYITDIEVNDRSVSIKVKAKNQEVETDDGNIDGFYPDPKFDIYIDGEKKTSSQITPEIGESETKTIVIEDLSFGSHKVEIKVRDESNSIPQVDDVGTPTLTAEFNVEDNMKPGKVTILTSEGSENKSQMKFKVKNPNDFPVKVGFEVTVKNAATEEVFLNRKIKVDLDSNGSDTTNVNVSHDLRPGDGNMEVALCAEEKVTQRQ